MKQQKGFTFAELITAIVILGILVALAAPGFRETIRNNRLTSSANLFLSALNLARSEAVKFNRRVVVCKSSDGASCTNIGVYEQGWLVFVDCDDDTAFDSPGATASPPQACAESGGSDIPLRTQDALPGEATLVSDDTGKALDVYVSYLGDGRARNGNGLLQNGCLELVDGVDSDDPRGRKILINTIGRVRIEEGTSCAG